MYVFRSACPAFYLEHPHSCLHHPVHEAYGLQVFRAHYIFVVYFQLVASLVIRDGIRATAYLHALSAVGTPVGVVQAHVALAAYSHAQCPMAEHLYTHQLPARSAYVLLFYLAVYLCHLLHVQLACQHYHIGKLGIELQCLYVRDVQLSRQVYLHAPLTAVGHHGHV